MDVCELSLAELSSKLQRGDLSVEAVANVCLERIRERDGDLHAWSYLDPDQVLAEARRLDRLQMRGPLHGIPVGVKDIMNTRDMPTECGSPIYRGRRPTTDAACVSLLREAGALVVGKTVTTEFACFHPGPTTNPRNPEHTPGGSSSGSAAAVASHMVPLALGSQTAASVIRPASYCGVVGFKAAKGAFSLAGVQPLAHSLDSLGWFTRHVSDAALVYGVLSGAVWATAGLQPRRPGKVAICRTHEWNHAEPAAARVLPAVGDALSDLGVDVDECVLPQEFAQLCEAQKAIMAYEAARSLVDERRLQRELLSPRMAELLDAGLQVSYAQYREAQALGARCRRSLGDVMQAWDVLVAPSATGEAPRGLGFTGDPVFSRMWTLLHVPAISLPLARGNRGLPVGVQLIGRPGGEEELFGTAVWIEQTFGFEKIALEDNAPA